MAARNRAAPNVGRVGRVATFVSYRLGGTDGVSIEGSFLQRSWAGNELTVLRLVWERSPA